MDPTEQLMTDIGAVDLFVAELERACPAPMEVAFAPLSAFQFAAIMQLALRHPQLPTLTRDAAQRFLLAAREYFADAPMVLALLDRGDDPSQDVHWQNQA